MFIAIYFIHKQHEISDRVKRRFCRKTMQLQTRSIILDTSSMEAWYFFKKQTKRAETYTQIFVIFLDISGYWFQQAKK
jgi:hypothetical protein